MEKHLHLFENAKRKVNTNFFSKRGVLSSRNNTTFALILTFAASSSLMDLCESLKINRKFYISIRSYSEWYKTIFICLLCSFDILLFENVVWKDIDFNVK